MQAGVYQGISHLSSDGTMLRGMGQCTLFDTNIWKEKILILGNAMYVREMKMCVQKLYPVFFGRVQFSEFGYLGFQY